MAERMSHIYCCHLVRSPHWTLVVWLTTSGEQQDVSSKRRRKVSFKSALLSCDCKTAGKEGLCQSPNLWCHSSLAIEGWKKNANRRTLAEGPAETQEGRKTSNIPIKPITLCLLMAGDCWTAPLLVQPTWPNPYSVSFDLSRQFPSWSKSAAAHVFLYCCFALSKQKWTKKCEKDSSGEQMVGEPHSLTRRKSKRMMDQTEGKWS